MRLSTLTIAAVVVVIAIFVGFRTMSERTSADAQQGIPAITDPAAVDQDQYGKMAQGAGVGAGSGAALGEAPVVTTVHRTDLARVSAPRPTAMHVVKPTLHLLALPCDMQVVPWGLQVDQRVPLLAQLWVG